MTSSQSGRAGAIVLLKLNDFWLFWGLSLTKVFLGPGDSDSGNVFLKDPVVRGVFFCDPGFETL